MENSSRIILNEELKRAQDLAEASQQNLENAISKFRNAGQNFGTSENSCQDFSLPVPGGNGTMMQGELMGNFQESACVGYDSVKREVKNLIGLTQTFGEVLVEVTKNQGIIKKAFLKKIESPAKDDPLEQELTLVEGSETPVPTPKGEGLDLELLKTGELGDLIAEISSVKLGELMATVKNRLEAIDVRLSGKSEPNSLGEKNFVVPGIPGQDYGAPVFANVQSFDKEAANGELAKFGPASTGNYGEIDGLRREIEELEQMEKKILGRFQIPQIRNSLGDGTGFTQASPEKDNLSDLRYVSDGSSAMNQEPIMSSKKKNFDRRRLLDNSKPENFDNALENLELDLKTGSGRAIDQESKVNI